MDSKEVQKLIATISQEEQLLIVQSIMKRIAIAKFIVDIREHAYLIAKATEQLQERIRRCTQEAAMKLDEIERL